MTMQIVQFLAVTFTALALIPGGAHLMEMPNKLALDERDYMIVQRIYQGWSLAGVALAGALVASLLLAIVSRSQTVPLVLAGVGFGLLLITLITFFVRVFPVNRETSNWTRPTGRFEEFRRRWESTHAANAILSLLAFVALLGASLSWKSL